MDNTQKEWLYLSGLMDNIENFVLGSALVDPTKLSLVGSIIFDSIKHVYDNGALSVSRESLLYDLDSIGKLNMIGGLITVDSIARISFSLDSNGFGRLCSEISEQGRLKQLQAILTNLSQEDIDPTTLINKTIDQLYRTIENNDNFGIIRADESAKIVSHRHPFSSTNIQQLDNLIGGMYHGDYHIVAARPSMGKSALGLQFGYESAVDGHGVLFISLEMSREVLNNRAINLVGGTPELLESLPLYYKCQSGLTFPQIAATIQMAKIMYNIEVVIIDYIGLVKGQKADQSTNSFLTYVSNSIQDITRSMGINAIILAQLNRNSEIQERQPAIYDLRDCGSLEQDADIITLIHRQNRGDTGKLIVAKHRHGELGEIRVQFDRNTLRFEGV